MNKSFCFFFQKEVLFFFEKKNQKTFVHFDTLTAGPCAVGKERAATGVAAPFHDTRW
jgi:hypothetical protein